MISFNLSRESVATGIIFPETWAGAGQAAW